ncbi:hypothetical protein GCM10011409_29890 [Lentibacillus populi]|uniref:Uncharacterized protein n=1 Tax=Lentibacillus populi TaxID=1827502 RepID=A0A9W5TZ78_9BACI|nr:hypothetical protein GCM10011409_29890 [Lentibacillus populi]
MPTISLIILAFLLVLADKYIEKEKLSKKDVFIRFVLLSIVLIGVEKFLF